MNQNNLLNYLLVIFLITVPISCTNKPAKSVTVSVSILPQKQWIDILSNKTLEVNSMIPPGSNPVTYNPTPMQMKALSHSSVYFYIDGLGFENVWLPKFKDLKKDMILANSTLNIERLEDTHHHDGVACSHGDSDPHLWVSPKRAILMVKNMYAVLVQEKLLEQNQSDSAYANLIYQLRELDSLYTEAAKSAGSKTIVIYHPALSYIASDYGFKQLSIEEEGKEPTAKHIKELIDIIVSENIKYIFIQKQFDKRNAELIAKETNAIVIEIDPLGYNYIEESRKLAEKLKML